MSIFRVGDNISFPLEKKTSREKPREIEKKISLGKSGREKSEVAHRIVTIQKFGINIDNNAVASLAATTVTTTTMWWWWWFN